MMIDGEKAQTCVHRQKNARVHTPAFACKQTHTCTHTTHTHTRAYKHRQTHAHTYTRTHTHTGSAAVLRAAGLAWLLLAPASANVVQASLGLAAVMVEYNAVARKQRSGRMPAGV